MKTVFVGLGILAVMCLIAFGLSCEKKGPMGPAGSQGLEGPAGPEGPEGPEGPAGTSLIKEYTGTIPSDGHHVLSVPEILGKRATTFVMAYWAFSTTPNIWTPMADGWLDNVDYAKMFAVSWTYGEVGFFGMLKDDLYLLQVFEHN